MKGFLPRHGEHFLRGIHTHQFDPLFNEALIEGDQGVASRAAKIIDPTPRLNKIARHFADHPLNFIIKGNGTIEHVIKNTRGLGAEIKVLDARVWVLEVFVFFDHGGGEEEEVQGRCLRITKTQRTESQRQEKYPIT